MVNSDEPTTWEALIVDDNTDNLNIAAQLLSFQGTEVHTAQGGEAALRVLETVTPTFILLDLSMPGLDGWQTLEKIRADPKTASTPVIALTGHTMDEELSRIKEVGFNGHITKPYLMANFLKCIKDVLSKMEAPIE
ncbi:MAG: response regulator [Anaerolineae bacterium]|nr:response regulator [Anaerolineae bacterium]